MAHASLSATHKRCISCNQIRAAEYFFRHKYITRTGIASTQFESSCKDCKYAARQQFRAKNAALCAERQREYYAKYKERIDTEHRAYYQRHSSAIKVSQFKYHLWEQYGLTIEQYEALVIAQDNRCKACGEPEGHPRKRRLHVDHDHQTGEVRGLLCHHCNCALGHLHDDQSKVRGLLAYIESFKQ